jgi:DNA-binding CsgD family transcriptional regulator
MLPLSARDKEVLWLMSQGLTYYQVGHKLGMSEQGAKSAARRVMIRMGSRNITHAVSVGLLEGLIGRWPECGTHAAYQKHRRLYQTADPACLIDKARHDRAQRAGETWVPLRKPSEIIPDQLYRHPVTGKTLRVTAVEGERADVVDVRTNRPGRMLLRSLQQSPFTKSGTRRRYEYVRIKEEEL